MNDILPSVNAVLKTNHMNLDQVSDRELTRAYMILRIQVLLDETGQPAPVRITELPDGYVPLWTLEIGALFVVNGKGRTLTKITPGVGTDCIYDNCPAGKAYINVTNRRINFHVCPDTPVLEVPF